METKALAAIPANSTLHFDVELVGIKGKALKLVQLSLKILPMLMMAVPHSPTLHKTKAITNNRNHPLNPDINIGNGVLGI